MQSVRKNMKFLGFLMLNFGGNSIDTNYNAILAKSTVKMSTNPPWNQICFR